jgi:hypothetical protein
MDRLNANEGWVAGQVATLLNSQPPERFLSAGRTLLITALGALSHI